MSKILRNIAIGAGMIAALSLGACEDDIDPIIESVSLNRVLSPLELTAKVTNKTTVKLDWTVGSDVDHYVVEFSEDSLVFATIVKTVTVAADAVPYSIALDGETLYSARVKGVSSTGVTDSKWSAVAFKTDAENIFSTLGEEAIAATKVTLTWPAGSEVTHFVINPGAVQRTITADEIAAGSATITGLTGETKYTVNMYKNTKQRGTVTFTTLVDIGDATAVYYTDDLSAIIAAAADGDELVLFPGDYTVFSGKITLNKSISIKGLYPNNKPIIHVQFILESGAATVSVKDVEMTGKYTDALGVATVNDHAFQYNSTGAVYGALTVDGCAIHDYNKSLFSAASSIASTIESISVNNCVVTNVLTNSADFIDFRASWVGALTLQNSTFNNCAPARDFIRLDDASAAFSGKTTNVVVDRCTLYGVAKTAANRILYVRFVSNTSKVTNTLIAETAGYYSNQPKTTQPECSKNNYFNAPGFITGGSTVTGAKFDLSGNHTTLDPVFTDVTKGNFKVSNETLIDAGCGDPRWLK